MQKIWKVGVVLALAALVAWVVIAKGRARREAAAQARSAPAAAGLPRLIEVGGKDCTPCKAMKPVLEALRRDYRGQLDVVELDYLDDEKAVEALDALDIDQIPTQLFLDASGKELDRHGGFISKEDVEAKWRALGVELTPAAGEGRAAAEAVPLLTWLFGALGRLVGGTPAVALAAAVVWGVLSVLLSPCHLASIPLIVGFIDAQGRTTTRRAFAAASLFALGILVTIGAVGGITAGAGRLLGSVGPWANWLVAVVFFLVALHLLDVIPMPWSGPGQLGMKRRGLVAAFVLGLVFGVAIGPCTFAYMAPMLAVTFKTAGTRMAVGVVLLVAYGVGHCSVIVLAGTFTSLVQRYLNWTERSRGAVVVKRLCGALVALGGVYLIHLAR